jgi:hypothetical protein
MVNFIQVDIDATYEGLTCRQMIQFTRTRLGVGPDDVNRYTDDYVVAALNMGQERFAKLTNCLMVPAVIIGQSGRQNYGLPKGTLKVVSARYYTGDNPSDYSELEILRDAQSMQSRDSQYRGTAGDPNYMFPTYRSGNRLMVGVSPIPTYDANILVNGTPYGKATGITGYTIAGDIAGSHKTGYAASSFLVDSLGRDLVSLGAMVGYPIYNTTQGTSGLITSIESQDAINDKVVASLDGAGTWAVGDAFEILMSNYGVLIDADVDHALVGTQLGVIADVISGKGTIAMDVSRKPIPLAVATDTMISEIPAAYQEAQIAFAVYWLASGMFAGVEQPQKAAEALAIFNNYVGEFKLSDETLEASENMVEQLEW